MTRLDYIQRLNICVLRQTFTRCCACWMIYILIIHINNPVQLRPPTANNYMFIVCQLYSHVLLARHDLFKKKCCVFFLDRIKTKKLYYHILCNILNLCDSLVNSQDLGIRKITHASECVHYFWLACIISKSNNALKSCICQNNAC